MFEEHITVKTNDIEQFKLDCKSLGIKPIVIHLQIDSGKEEQVMTSKCYKEDYYSFTPTIPDRLRTLGYEIVREKYELNPFKYTDLSECCYLESHIRIENINIGGVDLLCNNYGLHKSKNAFKIVKGTKLVMLTLREYEIDLKKFTDIIEEIKWLLDVMGVKFDKVEIEACVSDTNTSVDDNWARK